MIDNPYSDLPGRYWRMLAFGTEDARGTLGWLVVQGGIWDNAYCTPLEVHGYRTMLNIRRILDGWPGEQHHPQAYITGRYR